MVIMEERKSLDAATGATSSPDSQAGLSDNVVFSAEMAAIYLGMTPAEFAESYKPKRADGRVDAGSKAGRRVDKGGNAQSQPVAYALGALRQRRNKQAAPAGMDAASKAGLLDWITAKRPFFAELEPRVKRGRRVLIGSAWEGADSEREAHFADLLSGRIRVAWLTGSEAAASLWSEEANHRAFAARGLDLLEREAGAIAASIAATASMASGASVAADPSGA